ncbi:MAG: hypothetical protein ACFHWX_11575 [Bacteroidota bacterium]
MLKTGKLILFILLITVCLRSQGQGISFSYLFPTNGYLSAPVSPFSLRGVGLDFGLVGIESGFTLYSIPGLPLEDLPFKSDKPLVGPGFATLVPLQLSLGVKSKAVSFKVLGGGFGLWNINPRINYGNFDRALRDFENWDVANSDLSMENGLGIGWMAGVGFEFHVSQKFSLTTDIQYLSGKIKSPIDGIYQGGVEGGIIETKLAEFPDAKTLLQGIEISLGVNMN